MKVLTLIALTVSMLSVSAYGVEIVNAGETGVKKVLGKVQEETYPPGFYIVNPLTTNIIMMNNQIQRFENETTVYTKDVQQAVITYVLNYNLSPGQQSSKIYVEVGSDWEEKLIPQVINGSLKNVIGKWNAIELVSNRDKASIDIEESIRLAFKDRGINISKLELTNIDYVDAFEQAVEAKVVAVQRAEEAKNTTVRVQEEANQRIIAAKADAEAMGIKTAALKESQSLILYEAVQKWDGILPKIVTSNESGSILNINQDILSTKDIKE